MHACMHMHACMYVGNTYACIHTYIHTHIHTYIHTCVHACNALAHGPGVLVQMREDANNDTSTKAPEDHRHRDFVDEEDEVD